MRGKFPGCSARYGEGKPRMSLAVKVAEEVSGVWIIKESPKNIKAGGWTACA